MKGLFLRSMEAKEKIIIFYIDGDHKITERCIHVLKWNDTHILAYCHYRKKIRTFKLENILSAGPMKKKEGA